MSASKCCVVQLVEHDKLPKFVGRTLYFQIYTTHERREEVRATRKVIKKYKVPTRSECKNLCDTIENKLLKGELSYEDSPRKKARAISRIMGHKYPGFAGIITRTAIILEGDDGNDAHRNTLLYSKSSNQA